MEQLYNYLPRELVTFILVTLFSLLIGLSQRRISLKREGETTLFGTDRTFTFIGILGYLLYILDPADMRLFMGGDAEPFEVERLAGFLHRQSIALVKVGWYSGKNELPEGLSVQNFEYIKLGPYIEKLGGLKSPDTNQHFYRIYGDEMKDITYRFWRI